MPKAIMLVFTEAVSPEREDDYNRWYDDHHTADVLRVPGLLASTRFIASAVQIGKPHLPSRYCAIYELDSAELSSVPANLRKANAEGGMVVTDSMSIGAVYIYEQLTERTEA